MSPIILQQVKLDCSIERAFELFTVNRELESWLTVKANVEPQLGGSYELFWAPDEPENDSTIGCKILAIEAPDLINFEWKGPRQFKSFMNEADPLTNVNLSFAQKKTGVQVSLLHTGWRQSTEWEEARQYFIKAWEGAFQILGKIS